MKVYQTNEIKNIALLGNDGSGKTTLTESLLFESGIIKRRGRITAKNTVSDYFPVEQERLCRCRTYCIECNRYCYSFAERTIRS